MWRTTCRDKQSGTSSCKFDKQALATGGWSRAECRSRCNTPGKCCHIENYTQDKFFIFVTHLNALKSLVNVSPPEVEPVEDGAVLVGEEGGQL